MEPGGRHERSQDRKRKNRIEPSLLFGSIMFPTVSFGCCSLLAGNTNNTIANNNAEAQNISLDISSTCSRLSFQTDGSFQSLCCLRLWSWPRGRSGPKVVPGRLPGRHHGAFLGQSQGMYDASSAWLQVYKKICSLTLLPSLLVVCVIKRLQKLAFPIRKGTHVT